MPYFSLISLLHVSALLVPLSRGLKYYNEKCIYFFPWCNNPTRAQTASLFRSVDHTKLDTHTHTHTGLLWTSNQLVTEASTLTANTTDAYPCLQTDSHLRSQQSVGSWPMPEIARLPGYACKHLITAYSSLWHSYIHTYTVHLTLYAPCIILPYVYETTRCTKFLWLDFIFY